MEIHLTNSFIKTAASWDDQPNFVDRNVNPGGIGKTVFRGTEGKDKILRRWNRRKRRKPTDVVNIYQMGIKDQKTLKEMNQPQINL